MTKRKSKTQNEKLLADAKTRYNFVKKKIVELEKDPEIMTQVQSKANGLVMNPKAKNYHDFLKQFTALNKRIQDLSKAIGEPVTEQEAKIGKFLK